ncbi:hypothetical protein ACFS07_05885 [Undibacterium arcticum]
MNHSLKIAVLVSHARHPVSGRPLRSASDAAALELACSLALPERLTVLCAGSASADDLRDYLGLGAASIEGIGSAGRSRCGAGLAGALIRL